MGKSIRIFSISKALCNKKFSENMYVAIAMWNCYIFNRTAIVVKKLKESGETRMEVVERRKI